MLIPNSLLDVTAIASMVFIGLSMHQVIPMYFSHVAFPVFTAITLALTLLSTLIAILLLQYQDKKTKKFEFNKEHCSQPVLKGPTRQRYGRPVDDATTRKLENCPRFDQDSQPESGSFIENSDIDRNPEDFRPDTNDVTASRI
jgi:hypothetical protein